MKAKGCDRASARKVLFLRHCGLDPQSYILQRVRDAGSSPA